MSTECGQQADVTPPEAERAVRFLVSGRVQGVGFRWWVARRATELGLRGWVRNLADGRVEVAALGSRASMDAMEGFLGRGPRLAHVEHVEKGDSPHQVDTIKSFEIR